MIVRLFKLHVKLTVSCGYCDTSAELWSQSVNPGERLPEMSLPNGWREVDGLPVCPAHRIYVDTALLKGDKSIAQRLREQLERECPGIFEVHLVTRNYWSKIVAPRLEELVVEKLAEVRPK